MRRELFYLLEAGSGNKAEPPQQVPLAIEALLARGRLLVMRREMESSNLFSRLGRSISSKYPGQRYCLDESPGSQ